MGVTILSLRYTRETLGNEPLFISIHKAIHLMDATRGVCPHCGQRGHQSNFCRFKKNNEQNQTAPQTGRADKAAPKGKKKKRRAGKRVAVTDNGSRRESEEEEEEISEEDSPIKQDRRTENARSARLNLCSHHHTGI